MDELIVMMYASAAFINMISFIPQVIKLLKDKTSSDAISLQTQYLWLYAVIAGLLYAVIIIKDPVLIMAVMVTFVGCLSITILTTFNRFKERVFGVKNKSLADLWSDTLLARTIDIVKSQILIVVLQPTPKYAKVSRVRSGFGIISAALLTALFFPAHV